jgi:hypothetical protein
MISQKEHLRKAVSDGSKHSREERNIVADDFMDYGGGSVLHVHRLFEF